MTLVDRLEFQARRNRDQLANIRRMRLREALPHSAGQEEFRALQEALEAFRRKDAEPVLSQLVKCA